MEVAQNELLDYRLNLLYHGLYVAGVHFVALFQLDGVYFVVVLEVQIGRNQLYLQTYRLNLTRKLLLVTEVGNGQEVALDYMVALLDELQEAFPGLGVYVHCVIDGALEHTG